MLLERGLFTARERVACFQFTPNGNFYYLRSFLFGGAGDKDNVQVNSHQHDGRNFIADQVMTGIDATISGTFAPYYSELPVLWRNFFGLPKTSVRIADDYSDDVAGARRKETFEWPLVGAPTIALWQLQVGEILYGRAKLRSFNLDTARNTNGGTTSGNAEFHANDILNYNAVVPGSVPQNAVFQINAANASTSGIFAVQVADGLFEEVTLAIGDTTSATKAAFEALNEIDTVSVSGTVAISAGEKHTVVGVGDTFTIYGDIVVDTATATTSSIQTAIRAKEGHSTAVVTGTITKPVENLVLGKTATSDPTDGNTHAGNAVDGDVTTSYTPPGQTPAPFTLTIDRGSSSVDTATSQVVITTNGSNWNPSNTGRVQTSSDNSTWTTIVDNVQLSTVGTAQVFAANVGAICQRYVRLVIDTSNAAFASWAIKEFVVTPATVVLGTANLTVQYDVSDGNVGDIEAVPGSGYIGTSTPQGGAGGTITVTVSGPENTPVSIYKVSGDGWTALLSQPGSDGLGPIYLPDSPPVEADNVLIYMVDTLEELDALDMGDEEVAAILLDVVGHTFAVGSVWNPVYTENRKQAPSNFVSQRPDITFTPTVWKGPTSEAWLAMQNGCVMGKKFFRIAYKCGLWEKWTDLKAQRSAAQDKGNENDLPTRSTPFVAADDRVLTFRETVIGPNGSYFIPA